MFRMPSQHIRGYKFLLRIFSILVIGAVCQAPARGLNPNSDMSQLGHTAWRVQDGFFNGALFSVTQTADGYLWIGTNSGLFRFDGVQFVPFVPPLGQKLPTQLITILAAGKDGDLWIGTSNGLSHWDGKNLTTPAERYDFIASIFQHPDGSVWFTHARGPSGNEGPLCHLIGTTVTCYGEQDGIPSRDLTGGIHLAIDARHEFWLSTFRSILRGKPGSFVRSPLVTLPKGTSQGPLAILPLSDDSAWVGIGTSGPGLGLQMLTAGQWKSAVLPGFDSSKLAVNRLLLDRDGALWIGTTDKGLYRIINGRVDHFGAEDGLSGDSVYCLYEDREGSIWVATTNGLDRFRDLPVLSFSGREGLSISEVAGVMASHDGSVRIANGSSLVALRQGRLSSAEIIKGLPGSGVTSMLEDRAGRLWIGIEDKLLIYEKGKFTAITWPDGGPIGRVSGIAEDAQDNIWVEHSGPPPGVIRITDGRALESIPLTAVPKARVLAADPKGGIWLGPMSGGLARYRDGKLETFPASLGPDAYGARQIIVTPDGLAFAALGVGLMVVRDGKAQLLTSRNGLPCDSTYGVVIDSRGYIWLYSECGLTSVAMSEIEKWWGHPDLALNVKTLDALDGVRPGRAPFQSSAKSTDGKLWFANELVLQMVDPNRLVANPVPPPVHIEGLKADRRAYSAVQNTRLPALTRDLEFDYTALSLVLPQRVKFRHRLDGYDTDWKDAGTRRAAFYTNLGPGKYTFRVIACNNDGIWNETGDALRFDIQPAFFQTAWFEALSVLSLLFLLWTLYRLRLRSATEQVRGRLTAQLAERERIARELHDTLLQGFQGLVLRFQGAIKQISDQEPSRQLMVEALDRADEALLEGRNRVRDLRSETATVNDLSESLRACIEELASDYPIEASATEVGTRQPLHPIVRDEAYRIAREALSNAFQHSKASKIEAEITYHSENLRLRLRDDGSGIDQSILNDGRSGHWGLSGMRERAEKIGAQFSIWSSPGAGTEIDLIIPAKVAYYRRPRRSPFSWIKRASNNR